MPAQKRSAPDTLHNEDEQQEENEHESSQQQQQQQEELVEEDENAEDKQEEEEEENDELKEERDADEDDEADEAEEDEQNSEESSSTSSESSQEKPEFIYVDLSEIRKDVQCPICLGIIKKTRTVMECLHRFCRECIDKSMRLGNNECPACRTHCASRRSLRDDPNYDALIAALYPDIDKYEEEELAFHEEERNRNKQIQASIAQVVQKQSEALVKRRTLSKDSAGSFMTRSQRNLRNAHSRKRRSYRGTEVQASEENEDENNGGKDSSSNDERSTEVRTRKCKRRMGIRPSQASSSAAKSEGGCSGNDSEAKRESRGISPGLGWSPEMLAWGGGGARSHTRHGNSSGCNSKSSRSSRISKLVDHFRSLNENNDEVRVKVLLVSMGEQNMPNLQQPYLYCQPNLPVKHLCDYVACNTLLQSEEVEMLVVRSPAIYSTLADGLKSVPTVDSSNCELLGLEEPEMLAGIRDTYAPSRDHLILAYRRKETTG